MEFELSRYHYNCYFSIFLLNMNLKLIVLVSSLAICFIVGVMAPGNANADGNAISSIFNPASDHLAEQLSKAGDRFNQQLAGIAKTFADRVDNAFAEGERITFEFADYASYELDVKIVDLASIVQAFNQENKQLKDDILHAAPWVVQMWNEGWMVSFRYMLLGLLALAGLYLVGSDFSRRLGGTENALHASAKTALVAVFYVSIATLIFLGFKYVVARSGEDWRADQLSLADDAFESGKYQDAASRYRVLSQVPGVEKVGAYGFAKSVAFQLFLLEAPYDPNQVYRAFEAIRDEDPARARADQDVLAGEAALYALHGLVKPSKLQKLNDAVNAIYEKDCKSGSALEAKPHHRSITNLAVIAHVKPLLETSDAVLTRIHNAYAYLSTAIKCLPDSPSLYLARIGLIDQLLAAEAIRSALENSAKSSEFDRLQNALNQDTEVARSLSPSLAEYVQLRMFGSPPPEVAIAMSRADWAIYIAQSEPVKGNQSRQIEAQNHRNEALASRRNAAMAWIATLERQTTQRTNAGRRIIARTTAIQGLLDYSVRANLARYVERMAVTGDGADRALAVCQALAAGLPAVVQQLQALDLGSLPHRPFFPHVVLMPRASNAQQQLSPFDSYFNPFRQVRGARPASLDASRRRLFADRYAGEKAQCKVPQQFSAPDILPLVFTRWSTIRATTSGGRIPNIAFPEAPECVALRDALIPVFEHYDGPICADRDWHTGEDANWSTCRKDGIEKMAKLIPETKNKLCDPVLIDTVPTNGNNDGKIRWCTRERVKC
ncbi:MAG: hypothetical protein JWO88_3613 [Frankiales bacterium]|nr:hypothetical protein [Frankiales bacterium]